MRAALGIYADASGFELILDVYPSGADTSGRDLSLGSGPEFGPNTSRQNIDQVQTIDRNPCERTDRAAHRILDARGVRCCKSPCKML